MKRKIFSSVQVKNKLRDRGTEHAFILGSNGLYGSEQQVGKQNFHAILDFIFHETC
jgi:hypothetical protein